MMLYMKQVCPVVEVSVTVKLVPATIADTDHGAVIRGTTHVGVEGRSAANVMGVSMIRLWDVTAVVLTV